MLMLCGISNGAWAQEAAEQWAGALGLDYNEGLGTSESDAFVIDEGHWGTFVENVGTIETTDLYFKLGTNLTIDECSTSWTPISGFAGYFNGNSQCVSMKNCTFETSTLFDGEADMFNNSYISNISYQYTFTTYDGLIELYDHISEWPSLSYDTAPEFTIDTSDGNIEIEIDPSSWSPIDDSNANISITGDNFIVFTFSSALDVSSATSTPVYLFTSDESNNTFNEHCKYKELIIDDIYDLINFISSEYDYIVNATQKLTFKHTEDLDFTGSSYSPDDYTLSLNFSGDISYESDYYIVLSTQDALNGVKLFDDTANSKIKYAIFIDTTVDDETELNEFEYFLTSSGRDNLPNNYKRLVFGSSNYDINYPSTFEPISSQDFEVKLVESGTYFNLCAKDAEKGLRPTDVILPFDEGISASYICNSINIDSEDGFAAFNTLYSIIGESAFSGASIYVYANSERGERKYDYDLSNLISWSSPININGYDPNEREDPIVLILPESSAFESYFSLDSSTSLDIKGYSGPSCLLANELLNGALFDPSKRGVDYASDEYDSSYTSTVINWAGNGSEASPYSIKTYGMLTALADYLNKQGVNSEDIHFQLDADINAQNNERLTDVDGSIKLAGYNTQTVQINNFKGTFNGKNHSIGGLTRPLFANLDGAKIEYLGIVDCNMTGVALTASATKSDDRENTSVTMSYVSGVSTGLIPDGDITAENCYAYNPSISGDDAYTDYSIISAGTVQDASGTHYILSENCYNIGSEKYSDCTLFIPTDNTIYTYSNEGWCAPEIYGFTKEDYCAYVNWGDKVKWIETPGKSNVCLLHNVIRGNYWFNHYESEDYSLDNLYSWYIVDKQSFDVNVSDMKCKIKNIYYSRNTNTSDAPAGLNTIYLPFAWNPATDLYDKSGKKITNAKVYVLADKINSDGYFDENEGFKNYTEAESLLFFKPENEDFAKVSNALPTILSVPSSGWYIKRTELANYGKDIEDNQEEMINGETKTYSNLYDRYWENPNVVTQEDPSDEDLRTGRSFMDINRLNTEDDGRAIHCGTFTGITTGTFDRGTYGNYSCFKLASKDGSYGFAKVTENSTVQPFRTFFAIADNGAHVNPSSGAKALTFGICGISDIEDTPTEIDGVATEGIKLMTTAQSRVYSIDGRYVGQYGNKKLAPGMYIMNGKKFVVK